MRIPDILALTFLACFSTTLPAQFIRAYGVELKLNLATQLMTFPEIPDEGTFQANSIGTLGAGIFLESRQAGPFSGLIRLDYIRKGFKLPTQYGDIGTPIYFEFDQINTFDFIDADFLLKYTFSHPWIPHPYAGFRSGFLIARKVGSDYYPFNASDYSKEMHDFEKFSLGWVGGIVMPVTKEFHLGLETNLEFVPTIRRANFRSRNWVTSLNIGYNFSGRRGKKHGE
ncbi:MAG: hypothetical protein IPH12_18910 [Saprospirales bacterium]|nr:hypothetical protein [Saprospirales bacterium]